MAPHVTELLFAAGGGDHIVGAVSYSDYPEAAQRIPVIGDSRQIDMERVLALKPDLLVGWSNGTSARQLEQLRQLGVPMFSSEPHKLDDVPDSVARLGQLLGTEREALPAAAELRRRLNALKLQYSERRPVRVFYQVWDKPLFTLNGAHIVSDALRTCGGQNIFADLKITAPIVDVEAVLEADPEAIVSTGERGAPAGGVDRWKAFPSLTAVRRGNLFAVNGNLLNRPGPRMIAGTAALCEKLDLARQRSRVQP